MNKPNSPAAHAFAGHAKALLVLLCAGALAMCLCSCAGSSSTSTASASASASASSQAKSSSGTSGSSTCVTEATGEYASGIHTATVTVAGYEPFTIELNADIAPVSVWQFCTLSDKGFYNGSTFHRIVTKFCLQGGDPTGTGSGSTDNTIIGEFSVNGVDNELADNFTRGTVAWARSSSMNSASCQWFITLDDSQVSALNGKYAAFGSIGEAGMAVVDKIVADYTSKATGTSGTISDKNDQPVIESVVIS